MPSTRPWFLAATLTACDRPGRIALPSKRPLFLAASLAACDRPTPPAPPAVPPTPTAPVAIPLAAVADSPAPLVPAAPTLDPGTCVSADRPTHQLVVGADGLTLDGASLGRAVTLAAAIADDPSLGLAIAPDIPFHRAHWLLRDLQDIPALRLWISVRVGDDPELRHIPILPPRLGILGYYLGLPKDTYTLRLQGDREVFDADDPFMLPAGHHPHIDKLLVIADYGSSWQAVAAALAVACGDATLIESPLPPPRRPTPAVRMASVTTSSDAIYKDFVRRIVRAHVNEVRYCYNLALRRNPRVRGRVTVAFTIDARGKVASAEVAENTGLEDATAVCIAAAVRRWSFVKPEERGEVSVRFAWQLDPG